MPIIFNQYLVYKTNEFPNFEDTWVSEIEQEFWNQVIAYDQDYMWKMKVRSPPKISAFQRFLSKTFYDQNRRIEIMWEKLAPYELKDISQKIRHLLKDDDDVIQQWLDKSDIEILLSHANSFEKLSQVVEIIERGYEDDQELQKLITEAIPNFFKDHE